MSARALLTIGVIALLVCVHPIAAVAGAPAMDPQIILSTGAEVGDAAFELAPTVGSAASWAPTSVVKRSGLRGLWVAGTAPGTFPVYPDETIGSAYLRLNDLSEYYSSSLSYWYISPSRGASDGSSFVFYYETIPGAHYRRFYPPDVVSWTQMTYDLSASANGQVSRTDLDVQFRFADVVEGGGVEVGNGQGPAIDDVTVTAWKYGPVRTVSAAQSGHDFRVAWDRPYAALNVTTPENRSLAYRVWRSAAGTGTWDEISTPARLGDAVTSFDDPILAEGVSYEYFVQAWDPGAGIGYGQGVKTDAVGVPAEMPTLDMSSPADDFAVDGGPVSITGTAADAGSGVESVDVLIQRADGKCWSGSVWTDLPTWMPAQSDGADWSTWSIEWTPDVLTVASPMPVSVTSRATDNSGRITDKKVQSRWVATSLLDGGAAFTGQNPVPVDVMATGSPTVRFKVGQEIDSRGWMPYVASTEVPVPSGDGLKTVDCQLSFDGGATVWRTASDDITLDTTNPVVGINSPDSGYPLNAGIVSISGSAYDASSGIAETSVRLRRADGKCWTGSAWTSLDTWLSPSTHAPDWSTWSTSWTPDATTIAMGLPVAVTARATDGAGHSAITAKVWSASSGSIALAGGAACTDTNPIPVDIFIGGDPWIRFKVGGVADDRGWMPYTPSSTVEVPSGDGAKTVTCEFSMDGGESTFLTVSDSVLLDTANPEIGRNQPAPGFAIASSVAVAGTSADAGSGVESVAVQVRRADGKFWNGSVWSSTTAWLSPQTHAADWSTWAFAWIPDPTTLTSPQPTSVIVRATDNAGRESVTSPVWSEWSGAITLDSARSHTAANPVPVAILATGGPSLRFRVNGVWDSRGWMPYVSQSIIAVPAEDGVKDVLCEYSFDGGATTWYSAEDSIELDTTDPSVVLSQPAADFALEGDSLAISGGAEDAGSGVDTVGVCIRRADGAYWDGTQWGAAPAWLTPTTHSAGWATWSMAWIPSAQTLAEGKPVSITARAVDGTHNATTTACAWSRWSRSLMLQQGSQFTNLSSVPVVFEGGGDPLLRFSVDGHPDPRGWMASGDATFVPLPTGDALKTVVCDASFDGGITTHASTQATITLDTVDPNVEITSPGVSKAPSSTVEGTAQDSVSGISAVRLAITSIDEVGTIHFWDGSQWVRDESVCVPSTTDGWARWLYSAAPITPVWSYSPITYRAVAEDAAGNLDSITVITFDPPDPTSLTMANSSPVVAYKGKSTISGVLTATATGHRIEGRPVALKYYSGSALKTWATKNTDKYGKVAFDVYPTNKTTYRLQFTSTEYQSRLTSSVSVTPRVSLTTPRRPSSAKRNRTFTTYGYLSPRHTQYTYPVKVIAYRYQSGRWVARKTFKAKAYNDTRGTKYVAKVSLPYTGKWKLRANAPSDSLHYSTWTAYTRYFRVY